MSTNYNLFEKRGAEAESNRDPSKKTRVISKGLTIKKCSVCVCVCVCVRACVRASVRACVRACVCVCVWTDFILTFYLREEV